MLREIIFKTSQKLKNIGVDFNDGTHPAILEMRRSIRQYGGVHFTIEICPDGSWTAESTNFDGIITGGKNVKEMNSMIKDAVFTYFNIPSHLCDDKLLKATNEPVTIEQWVLTTAT